MGHGHRGEIKMNMVQTRMIIEVLARMTVEERQTLIAEMDKRFPNLVDDLGTFVDVTQRERKVA